MTTQNKSRKALLGTKLGMTQIWDENGVLRPVTVVRVDTTSSPSCAPLKTTAMKPYSLLLVS